MKTVVERWSIKQQLPVLSRFVMEMLFIAERGDKSRGAFCKIGGVFLQKKEGTDHVSYM